MGRSKGHALRMSAVAIGAVALAGAFAGTANASPLGGLGGGDDGNSSGSGDFEGHYGYDSGGYSGDNGYQSMFGDHDQMPSVHNGLMSFNIPDVETR